MQPTMEKKSKFRVTLEVEALDMDFMLDNLLTDVGKLVKERITAVSYGSYGSLPRPEVQMSAKLLGIQQIDDPQPPA